MTPGSHPCLPRFASLSGAAPWPSFWLFAGGKTHCKRRNHKSCMRRPGTYVFEVGCTYVDVMWDEAGVDCPTVTPFLESVLLFSFVALLSQGTAGLDSTVPRKVLHTYTLSCHCRPRIRE
ncbi:hypothetical protein TcCL_NonESM04247 [Trypanosoma cruzi]|nr:hypothetical protein TcCL_NonESM04247 [Trypanosoma cruzi]